MVNGRTELFRSVMAFYAKVASAILMTEAPTLLNLEAHLSEFCNTSGTSEALSEQFSSGQNLSLNLFSAELYGAVCRQTSGVSLEEREVRLLLLARSTSLQRMRFVVDASYPC